MMKQDILLELAVRSQEFINSYYRQWMGRGSEVAGSSFQICKLSHTLNLSHTVNFPLIAVFFTYLEIAGV